MSRDATGGFSSRKIGGYVYWALAGGLAIGLLAAAVRGVDWAAALKILRSARIGTVIAAMAVSSGSYFLRALRWRVLLRAFGGRVDAAGAFGAIMAGYLGNNFLPARAGDVLRSAVFEASSGLTKTYVFTTTVVERLADGTTLVLIGSLLLLHLEHRPGWLAAVCRMAALAACAGIGGLVVLPRCQALWDRVVRRLPLPDRIRQPLAGILHQALLGLRSIEQPRRFLSFAFFTLVIWTSDATTAVILGRALGMALPYAGALLLLTAMGLGSALPSTPGYIGVYQFATVMALQPFGFSRDQALAYSILGQAGGYVVVAFWGALGLWHIRRKRMGRAQRAGSAAGLAVARGKVATPAQ